VAQQTITAAIPTHNRGRLLRRAIRSVQAQTYPHVRICVYDNASSDGTAEVVQELALHDKRIAYHRHASNIGSVPNILYALRQVETPLFHVLSDDDLIFPEFYAEAVRWLERYPDAVFSAGGTVEAAEDGTVIFTPQSYWPRDGCYAAGESSSLLLRGFHPSWTTIVFRREATLAKQGPPDARLPNLFDLDFTVRAALRNPFILFRKPSGIFLRHERSGGDFADTSLIEQYEIMAQAYPDRTMASDISTQLGKRICQIAGKQLLRGDRRQALETMLRYHRKYSAGPQSVSIHAAAAIAAFCPPLTTPLRAADTFRRTVRSHLAHAAARRTGAPRVDKAAVLQQLQLGSEESFNS
jgi:glycosyltransferase involved in cell wall biosynthesis